MVEKQITFTTEKYAGLSVRVVQEHDKVVLKFDLSDAIKNNPNPGTETEQHKKAAALLGDIEAMPRKNFVIDYPPKDQGHVPDDMEPKGDVYLKPKAGGAVGPVFGAITRHMEECNKQDITQAAKNSLFNIRNRPTSATARTNRTVQR